MAEKMADKVGQAGWGALAKNQEMQGNLEQTGGDAVAAVKNTEAHHAGKLQVDRLSYVLVKPQGMNCLTPSSRFILDPTRSSPESPWTSPPSPSSSPPALP